MADLSRGCLATKTTARYDTIESMPDAQTLSTNHDSLPNHLGLILDGNRRWAREQGLPTLKGHQQGYENLKTIARQAFDAGVSYVSAYIFSIENWNRTKKEVDYLMSLALKMAQRDSRELIKENIKIVVLGVEERVPQKVIAAWRKAEQDSQHNSGGVLALCFNYGGLREISDALKAMLNKGISANEMNEQQLLNHLYHPEIPPIDLMIRTSGEQRLSNFMLARMAYAELYFSKKPWPAFDSEDLEEVLKSYSTRQRRFGGNGSVSPTTTQ